MCKGAPKYDYMKYWRVIRYWVKAKYKITNPELEMLLFLHGEGLFNKHRFKEFEQCMSWDKPRFYKLLKDGWVVVWRKRQGKTATLYQLSYKGKRMIDNVYKKLNGDAIGESPSNNPLFLSNVSYADKVYRNQIIEMNKFIKQQQRLSPE